MPAFRTSGTSVRSFAHFRKRAVSAGSVALLWTWGRALRFADGPDEVHLGVVVKAELARIQQAAGSNALYYTPPYD